MHDVSELWTQILSETGHQKQVMVKINGVEYGESRIIRASVNGTLFDAPSVGNAISRTLDLEIMPYPAPRGAIPPMSEIRLFVRLVSADGQRVSEYIPKGVFFSDTVKRDSDTGAVTITAFDAVMRMERQFGVPKNGGYGPVETFTVSFDDGFRNIQKFQVHSGDAMPTPETPTHSGDLFGAWYPNPADTPTVTRDMRFFAQWLSITGAVITSYPAKSDYAVGEALDYTGLEVTASLSDGSTLDITDDCAVVPAEGTTVTELGDIMVDVLYGGESLGTFWLAANVIARGDWWTLRNNGLLDIYCAGNMPDYSLPNRNNPAPWYPYRERILDVTIRNSATSIGDNAFNGCHALESAAIPDSVTSIGANAFLRTNLTNVTIPDSVSSIGGAAFSWSGLVSVTIPGSVTQICTQAFYACFYLTSVELLDGVRSVGERAFAECNRLISVAIPDSVTSIGSYAFYTCYLLTSVRIPGGVERIEEGVFNNCAALESVAIPDSVTWIENRAFLYCDSLTDVYYSGSEEQWSAILMESDNDALRSATIHYNS